MELETLEEEAKCEEKLEEENDEEQLEDKEELETGVEMELGNLLEKVKCEMKKLAKESDEEQVVGVIDKKEMETKQR